MLSASLSDKIDTLIKLLNIPTEDEIREAEIAEIVISPERPTRNLLTSLLES